MINSKNRLKIVFLGTSDKSTPILEVLKNNYNLVLCITKADTKIGRHYEQKETQVKKWAQKNDIECVAVENFKNSNLSIISNKLLNEEIDLGIVADFSFIIPTGILSIPGFGLINVHFSLLPKYRGASPMQHTILNGEKVTGITYQLIDTGMDTGDIIYQIEHKLKGTETTESLYKELFDIAADNLTYVIDHYVEGILVPKKQNHEKATYCYSITHPKSTFIYKEDAKIDWSIDLEIIEKQIRAFFPWPIAWTTLKDMQNAEIYITNEGISEKQKENNKKFLPKHQKDLKIQFYKAVYEKNILKPIELKVEGKSMINWQEFLNGYA